MKHPGRNTASNAVGSARPGPIAGTGGLGSHRVKLASREKATTPEIWDAGGERGGAGSHLGGLGGHHGSLSSHREMWFGKV
jgi:hypothetical protein